MVALEFILGINKNIGEEQIKIMTEGLKYNTFNFIIAKEEKLTEEQLNICEKFIELMENFE